MQLNKIFIVRAKSGFRIMGHKYGKKFQQYLSELSQKLGVVRLSLLCVARQYARLSTNKTRKCVKRDVYKIRHALRKSDLRSNIKL